MTLILLPFYIAGCTTGEFNSTERNIKLQKKNEARLIGCGYNEQTRYYKFLNCEQRRTKIIALGTSRVMQFKEQFFNTDFYNCGGAVGSNYDEYINYLKNLSFNPEVIVLGLDSWVFNEKWNKNLRTYTDFEKIEPIKRNKLSMLISIFGSWLIKKKWTFDDLKKYRDNVGFNGRIKNEGFLNDGSYYYGYIYTNPESSGDYQFKDTYTRINNGCYGFEYGDIIDNKTLELLDDLLKYCSDKNIYVIGFVPPFAPSIYDKMMQSNNYKYVNQLDECKRIFDKYNFEYYNFVDGGEIKDTDDSCFIDGFHGSEIVYGRMCLSMIDDNSKLLKYLDCDRIQFLLKNAYNGLLFDKP